MALSSFLQNPPRFVDTASVPGSQKSANLEVPECESQKKPRPSFRQTVLIEIDSCNERERYYKVKIGRTKRTKSVKLEMSYYIIATITCKLRSSARTKRLVLGSKTDFPSTDSILSWPDSKSAMLHGCLATTSFTLDRRGSRVGSTAVRARQRTRSTVGGSEEASLEDEIRGFEPKTPNQSTNKDVICRRSL